MTADSTFPASAKAPNPRMDTELQHSLSVPMSPHEGVCPVGQRWEKGDAGTA